MDALPPLTFIAHAPEHEGEAESLARRLRDDAGVAVWFGPWSIEAGDDEQEQMERGLLAARVCVVCIGDAGGEVTGWQSQQMRVAIMRRVRDRAVRVIPLLLPGASSARPADLPLFLQLYKPVVFRSLDDGTAFNQLLSAILRELSSEGVTASVRRPEVVAPRTASPPCADLELRLYGEGTARYAEVQLTPPEGAFSATLAAAVPVALDREQLLAASLSPEQYGRLLSEMLFADSRLQSAWVQACAYAAGAGGGLRVRLRLDGDAETLHGARWELLHDPIRGAPIALGEQVRFARYLSSADLTPIERPASSPLKALAAVASPGDLERYSLARIDAASEVARVRAGLGASEPHILARELTGAAVTLDALLAALREQPHLLYLVCHATAIDGEPYLWLEGQDGTGARVPAKTLVQALGSLGHRPALVVLGSCQSGGPGHGEAWAPAALGPALARVGVAAVLAMQGQISAQALERFTPVFLAELARDGSIDRAAAAARTALRDGPEWWLPVLFLRLRDGNLWSRAAH